MKAFFSKNILFFLLVNGLYGESPWYHRKCEGWYYFQEEDSFCPEEAQEFLEEKKKKAQEALSLALVAPTKENVEKFVLLAERDTDQSAQFADMWSQIAFDKRKNQLFISLSDRWFLLFCFEGKNALSAPAAKTVQTFTEQYGWRLKAVSSDGCGTEGLETFEVNQGILKNFQISPEKLPASYAIDPLKNKIVCLGTGVLSVDDLEKAIGNIKDE